MVLFSSYLNMLLFHGPLTGSSLFCFLTNDLYMFFYGAVIILVLVLMAKYLHF